MPVTDFSEAKRRLLQGYFGGTVATTALGLRAVAAGPANGPAPLSPSQEHLVLREWNTPEIPRLYNECITLRMMGRLDVALLERCMAEIVGRHEIWRTSYAKVDEGLFQFVHPAPSDFPLPVFDLHDVPAVVRETIVRELIAEVVQQPFDLATGPLLRTRLVRTGDIEHRLYLIAHLSIVDGVSAYQVFPQELAALYKAYSSGRQSPLRALSIQFGDYSRRQQQWLQSEDAASQLAYWRAQLAGELPLLAWPKPSQREPKQKFRGAVRSFALPEQLSATVKALSQREGVTLFTTLLAAFTTLLHSYTQQSDIVIGTPSPAGRRQSEVQGMLGYFLNPVAIRFDVAGDPTFRDLLRQTQRLTLEAISNDGIPLELLQTELALQSRSTHPIFTVAMSLQPPSPPLPLEWTVTSMDVGSGGAPWDLYIAFIDRPEGIMGRLQYNPNAFESEVIGRMLHDYENVLAVLCAGPAKNIGQVKTPA